MPRVPVLIEPAGVRIWVEAGTTALQAARLAGVVVPSPCGGRGVCGSCAVRVLEGHLEPPDEYELVGLRRAPEGVRLACRATISTPVTIRPMVVPANVTPSEGAVRTVDLHAGVDLGTTSVGVAIVEASTGCELARASVPNRQYEFGADVLSRVGAALSGGRRRLSDLAWESIAEALVLACSRAHVSPVGVTSVVIAGNTAMAALLVDVDVSSLATHPFTPPYAGGATAPGERLLSVSPRSAIRVVPPVGAFVGGDAYAAVISARLRENTGAALLVDMGTNAEVVLSVDGHVMAASTAAGPAFEGAGVTCGGPAAEGAVTSVRLARGVGDGRRALVELDVLGDVEPGWFSGSGLVSAMALLRRLGHLGEDGSLSEEGPLADRFFRDDRGVLGVSLHGERFDAPGCLFITQLDIRQLQLAKAAVRVAIVALLQKAGVSAASLTNVLVAGAFGAAIHVDDLVELGVLPAVSRAVTRPIGNAALDGALELAVEGGDAVSALEADVLDLASDPDFSARLMSALSFSPYED